jgi:uncharacterized Zn finger protein
MAQCQAKTKKGAQCRGGAMFGSPFCGPHNDYPPPEKPQRVIRRQKPSEGPVPKGMYRCHGCGRVVHRAGKLVSYHPPCEIDVVLQAWPS